MDDSTTFLTDRDSLQTRQAFHIAEQNTGYINPGPYLKNFGLIHSFFDTVNQPSANDVARQALIKKHDPGEQFHLQYRAGGASMGADYYAGSFSVQDEITDDHRLVMKCLSTDFDDVLITKKRLQSVIENHGDTASESVRHDYVKRQLGWVLQDLIHEDVGREYAEEQMNHQSQFVDPGEHERLLKEKLKEFQELDPGVQKTIQRAYQSFYSDIVNKTTPKNGTSQNGLSR